MSQKKTSAEWEALSPWRVVDPDGWDRTDLTASWGEKITYAQFRERLMVSTIELKDRGASWQS